MGITSLVVPKSLAQLKGLLICFNITGAIFIDTALTICFG